MEETLPDNIHINGYKLKLSQCNWPELKGKENSAEWWLKIVDFLEELSNNQPFVLLKTSGSTGEPKTNKVEKIKLFNAAIRSVEYFNLDDSKTGLLCLPAEYIAGKMMIIRAMISGMHLICVEPSHYPLEKIDKNIDFIAMVPMQAKYLVQHPIQTKLIKKLIIGGTKVDKELEEQLIQTPIEAFETFGMTETFSHIALRPITSENLFFKTLNGVEIAQGYFNELIISVANLGIYRLKTSDIIKLHGSDQFEWIGRKDFIINTGGIKISPEQVESKINHLIPQSFYIIGLADEKLGEKLVLVIEGEKYDTQALKNEIKIICSTYENPKSIQFLNSFPRTDSGKIKRLELKQSLTQHKKY